MKNLLIRLLYRNKRQDHQIGQRTLVVSTTALGDTLWATPAIKALKKKGCFVAVLTSPIGEQALKNNPHIDTLIVAKRRLFFSCLPLIRKLKALRIDSAVFFHVSQRLIFPVVFSVAPSALISTRGMNKGLDPLFTHLIDKVDQEHEICRRMRLVQCEGSEKIEIFLTEKEKQAANAWLCHCKQPAVLHVGSNDRFKRWPLEYFRLLAQKLTRHGYDVVLTGSAKERAMTEKIGIGLNVAGRASLREQMAIIEQSQLMVTNDTGPMHVAFACDTPVVAVFGVTNPKECGPHLAHKAITIRAEKTCSPCLEKKCLDPFCMRQIMPDDVGQALKNLLESPWQNINT